MQTNWVILTGAPNSGKSSVLDRLAFLGYHTVPESARLLINEGISQGRTISEIRADESKFQREVFALNQEAAKRFSPKELLFFDRGFGDSIAYYNVYGLDAGLAIDSAKTVHYRKVFLFERLPHDRNEFGDERIADTIELAIKSAYANLGYELIPVPPLPISERVALILKNLN